MTKAHRTLRKRILVIGGGGHAKVVLDALRGRSYDIVGILESNKDKIGSCVCGVPIIGTDEDAVRYFEEGVTHAVVAIGHLGNGAARMHCIQHLQEIGFQMDPIVHKKAIVSPYATIGDGTVVLAGAIVNAGSCIGNHCIINTGAIIEHDVIVGENVHVAPRATISGGSIIGDGTLIGMGSCVIQGRVIGRNCIVGAGSVVIRDVANGTTVIGVPSKPLKGES